MANKRELEALLVLAGKVDPSIRKAFQTATKQTNALNKVTQSFGKVAEKAFSALKIGAAAGAAAVGAGLAYMAKKGIDYASDLREVQNVIDVTFGQNADYVNEWAKSAKKNFGLSELAAKQFAGTLGAMMRSSGIADQYIASMSTTLASLSGDFASFRNMKPEEAFDKLRSVITGESEPLDFFGVDMRAAALDAYRLSKGIKVAYSEMSNADQIILRYNYLLETTQYMQGDFMRNNDSFANQLRVLQVNFQELAGKIMSGTIPAFEKLFQKGNQLIESFAEDPEKIERLSEAVAGIFERTISYIPTAIEYAKQVGQSVSNVYNSAKSVYDFIDRNWRVIGPLIYTIVGAMLAWKATLGVIATYKALTTAAVAVQKVLNAAKMRDAAVTAYLKLLYAQDAIAKASNTAATWASVAATRAATAATNLWSFTVKVATVATRALGLAMLFAVSPIGLVILGIVALVAAAIWLWKNWDQVSAWIVGVWQNKVLPFFQGVGDWFSNLWGGIVESFQSAWSGIETWLVNLWEGILGIVKGYVNRVWIEPLNFLIDQINKINFKVPDWIPGIGGKEIAVNIPKLQTFARGGLATQPSIFGEAGPEMAIPIKRTPRSLGLLNKTAKMLGVGGENVGSAGGGGITFVYSPTYGPGTSESQVRADFEEFKRMMNRWVREQGRVSFG